MSPERDKLIYLLTPYEKICHLKYEGERKVRHVGNEYIIRDMRTTFSESQVIKVTGMTLWRNRWMRGYSCGYNRRKTWNCQGFNLLSLGDYLLSERSDGSSEKKKTRERCQGRRKRSFSRGHCNQVKSEIGMRNPYVSKKKKSCTSERVTVKHFWRR